MPSAPGLMAIRVAPSTLAGLNRGRKNRLPLLMNKDALQFLKRGRGGALSCLDAVETIAGEAFRQALEAGSTSF